MSVGFKNELSAYWFVSLLVFFFFFCLCRSWECQAGTSRRTGLQHQHSPPQVAPRVSPPPSLPVSPPVLVPTHPRLLVAGRYHAAECFSSFGYLIWRRYCVMWPIFLHVHVLLLLWWEYRTWFQLSPASFLNTPEPYSPNPNTDMGGNEGGGGERWNFFGTRSVVQKSPTDPGSDTSTGERFTPSPASGCWL